MIYWYIQFYRNKNTRRKNLRKKIFLIPVPKIVLNVVPLRQVFFDYCLWIRLLTYNWLQTMKF